MVRELLGTSFLRPDHQEPSSHSQGDGTGLKLELGLSCGMDNFHKERHESRAGQRLRTYKEKNMESLLLGAGRQFDKELMQIRIAHAVLSLI